MLRDTDLPPAARRAMGLPMEPAKRSKYGNTRCYVTPDRRVVAATGRAPRGWDKFDSQGEAHRWVELLQRRDQGIIDELQRQVSFDLVTVNTRTGEAVVVSRYRADFSYRYVATATRIVEDFKGHRTPMFRLKKKWLKLQMGIEIVEVER